MSDLAEQSCVPCKGGVPPMEAEEAERFLARLDDGWDVAETHHLERTYEFLDFAEALAFVNAIGAIAEEQGHHPDIHLAWGQVGVEIWTHKIDGLTESDFVLAAKFDRAYEG
ncbi:MAG TPA: 4a-hydroxytetrahydrobiopterin dehydratase [Gemmatimonadota bacterium]|nr:4a-hydroxytetrahydrobiopterin dehydratase [Gemmatimonadota bacterium]